MDYSIVMLDFDLTCEEHLVDSTAQMSLDMLYLGGILEGHRKARVSHTSGYYQDSPSGLEGSKERKAWASWLLSNFYDDEWIVAMELREVLERMSRSMIGNDGNLKDTDI
jgi:hypothetical protein